MTSPGEAIKLRSVAFRSVFLEYFSWRENYKLKYEVLKIRFRYEDSVGS